MEMYVYLKLEDNMGFFKKIDEYLARRNKKEVEFSEPKEEQPEEVEQDSPEERKKKIERIEELIESTFTERETQFNDVEEVLAKDKISLVDIARLQVKASRLVSLLVIRATYIKEKYGELHVVSDESDDEMTFAANVLEDRDAQLEGVFRQWKTEFEEVTNEYEESIDDARAETSDEILEGKSVEPEKLKAFRAKIEGLMGEFAILEQRMLETHSDPEETLKLAVTQPTFSRRSERAGTERFTGEEPTLEHVSPTDDTVARDLLAITGEVDETGETVAAVNPIDDTVEYDGTEKTLPSLEAVQKDTIDPHAATQERKPVKPEDIDEVA